MARCTQQGREFVLLGILREGLELALISLSPDQFLRDLPDELLAVPSSFVVAKGEDLFNQMGRLPPGCQMAQQRGLACTTHTTHEEDVALGTGEQSPLNL